MPDIKTLAAARNVYLVDTFTKSTAKLAKMLSACDPHQGERAARRCTRRKSPASSPRRQYVEGQRDSGVQVHLGRRDDLRGRDQALPQEDHPAGNQEARLRGRRRRDRLRDDLRHPARHQEGLRQRARRRRHHRRHRQEPRCHRRERVGGARATSSRTTPSATSTSIYFVNPVDFAKQIADSEVFSAFGISYIENWAGLGTLVSTGSVAAGTIYATVKEQHQGLHLAERRTTSSSASTPTSPATSPSTIPPS